MLQAQRCCVDLCGGLFTLITICNTVFGIRRAGIFSERTFWSLDVDVQFEPEFNPSFSMVSLDRTGCTVFMKAFLWKCTLPIACIGEVGLHLYAGVCPMSLLPPK